MTEQAWYKTTLRWGQTNLVEIDPLRYDQAWWRAHWRRTSVQGLVVNAGGIVAYYPSEFPLHHRAHTLGERDLFGEIVRDARADGLKVIARMDSNRVAQDFYEAHPDWICVDAVGAPYRIADKYVTCVNSPYYAEYLPGIMREIIRRSQPDGFSDNSWAGMPRDRICYCVNCKIRFAAFANGAALPAQVNWNDVTYRRWITWNYQRRTELWELNNATTTSAGGEHCIWSGMVSGDMLRNGERFNDMDALLARAEIVMLDHQRRTPLDAFEQNTETGKRLHGLLGWDKLIPESMPQYLLGAPAFRLTTMPPQEVRLWSSSAFAGGIQPWWHHIGSVHEDRRQYTTAEAVFSWHAANEDILLNRQPQADVGIVWSQQNHDFYGQDKAQDRTMQPYRGAMKAMDRAGITYLPVHVNDIVQATGRLRALILPNIVVMSDAQVSALEAYVAAGGSVIASGETSLMDETGELRKDFALAKLFGVKRQEGSRGEQKAADPNIEVSNRHTYLRLMTKQHQTEVEPNDSMGTPASGERHPILDQLAATDIVPFGGYLPLVRVESGVTVLATFIPEFPIFPPETAWMREPWTDIPAITLREPATGGKLIWFVADLDRCFGRDEHPDHGLLLANAVRWLNKGQSLVQLEGTHGVISPSLYAQGKRQILHLNNRLLTSRVPGRQNELIPIGPVHVRMRAALGQVAPHNVDLRVCGQRITAAMDGEELVFEVQQILDHELVVIDWG